MKRKTILGIIVGLGLVVLITIVLSGIQTCKAPVVEKQVEEQQEEEKAEETTSPVTEETPPVIGTPEEEEEVAAEEEMFEEIVNAPEIEGLKFDQDTRTYLAEANNPYGLEAGVEAGVYVKEAIEINGEMEDSVGLKLEVIEVIQENIYQETKEYYLCPIPFNLKEAKGIKITELKFKMIMGLISGGTDTVTGVGWGGNVSVGSVFYTPISGLWHYSPLPLEREAEDKLFYVFPKVDYEHFDPYAAPTSDSFQSYGMFFKDIEKAPGLKKIEEVEKERILGGVDEEMDMYEVKLGEPLGKITGETVLDLTANKTSDECFYFENPGEYQFYFENRISNIKGKFETLEILAVGKESEKLKVFILP